jgi:hypothetical protein
MAKSNNLFTTLRKSVARAVPGATHRGTKRGGAPRGERAP